jgi:hypothetical protein
MVRTAFISPAVAACLLLVASCDGGEPDAPNPTSTSTSTALPSSATASPTTVAVPPYLARYSAHERTAYVRAIAAYRAFSVRQAQFNTAGEATREAKLFYRNKTAAWQTYWARLRANEQRGLQIFGMGKTLWIRPVGIRLDAGGGGEVTLKTCGVSKGVKVFQNGEPLAQPEPKPTIVRVRMVRLTDAALWRVLSERVGARC